jgi:hypothetical protein
MLGRTAQRQRMQHAACGLLASTLGGSQPRLHVAHLGQANRIADRSPSRFGFVQQRFRPLQLARTSANSPSPFTVNNNNPTIRYTGSGGRHTQIVRLAT